MIVAEVLVPGRPLDPQTLDCGLPFDAGVMVNPAGFLVIKLMPLDYLADSGLGDALHSLTFTKFIKKGFDLFLPNFGYSCLSCPMNWTIPMATCDVLTLLGLLTQAPAPLVLLHAA